ncbi:MAG: cation:proton antiporter, partial [Acidobacteria bacterium]|nr:cation:proton antiporter [Acidobacteriota bacterium]
GLIALAYGAALACHAYGFLAVFAAGLALRRVERLASGTARHEGVEAMARSGIPAEDIAAHADEAPAYMAQAVLAFNEQLERIGEVTAVIVVGATLSMAWFLADAISLALVLFLGIRPLSAALGLVGAGLSRREYLLIGWFGIRGLGSLYYLMFAINHGLPKAVITPVVGVTLAVVALSIVVHGATVTPVMNRWSEHRPAR